MRSGSRYSIGVLGFAVLLVVLFVVGIQQNWGIFRQPTKEDMTNVDAVNELALEPGAVDMASLDLVVNLAPPSSGEEVRALTFQIDGVNFYIRDDNDAVTVTEVCLDYVYLVFQPRSQETFSASLVGQGPYCLPVEESDYVEDAYEFTGYTLDRSYWVSAREGPQTLSVNIDDPDILNLNFWYPYDSFQIDVVLQAQYSFTLDTGESYGGTIKPFIEWNIQTSGTRLWDVKLAPAPDLSIDPFIIKDYLGEGTVYDTYTISFNRLLLYRLIFPFFMIAMVLLLCFMPLFNDRDSLIDVSAAMLFGIFGLKGIIGPGDQMGQTVMDIALIGLYVLLAFAVFLFFIRRLFSPRQTEE